MKRNAFMEAKIKMVMKLKKLTRRDAVAEIARIDAVRHPSDDDSADSKRDSKTRRRPSPNFNHSTIDEDDFEFAKTLEDLSDSL